VSARREKLRWTVAAAGPLLFLASSLMPWFEGGATRRARCAGREFTGEWDDCIPDAEQVVPGLTFGAGISGH